jgi:hypothetical protein
MKIDIADLDCIFLSYDEPNKEENWTTLKNLVPWARRVDGVKGSDSAHKAAAAESSTDRFILVDGDNIPDSEFFDLQLDITEENADCVFRWRARNIVNGLAYGNGGLSCWTKSFIDSMKTHENSDGRGETLVEFCFDPKYWAMHDCYSTTIINHTPYQAWRAGFREGVKMCLDRGQRPTLDDFKERVYSRNLDNLMIWHNIGADSENGLWAIAGARQGTYMTMLTNWDWTKVRDFDELSELWLTVKDYDPTVVIGRVAEDLTQQLDLPVCLFDQEQSKFFKHHLEQGQKNLGPMVRENQ